jgi:hypothetical protein
MQPGYMQQNRLIATSGWLCIFFIKYIHFFLFIKLRNFDNGYIKFDLDIFFRVKFLLSIFEDWNFESYENSLI